jgi:hypothetical protein
MNSMHFAVAFSFLVGVLGYIIAHFWLRPIEQYKKQKHSLKNELDLFEGLLDRYDIQTWKESTALDLLHSVCRAATVMTEVYTTKLPYWYKLVLGRRGETPIKAAAPIIALSNIRHPEHARIRLQQVRKALQISS